MPAATAPPGATPATANGTAALATGLVTGPIRVTQRVTPGQRAPEPAPMAPTEPPPIVEPMQPPPEPGVEEPEPVPVETIALLQEILLLEREEVRLLSETQEDMRALRQVLAGPFRFLTFTPQSVNLSTPATILANDRLSLLPIQNFPGAVLYIAVMFSDRTARIVPRLDGTENIIDVDQLVTFGIDQAVAPAGVQVQADPANSRFTTVMNPGAPEGMAFFSSFSLEVQNSGSASIDVLDFLVVMRQYVPLELFPRLTKLAP